MDVTSAELALRCVQLERAMTTAPNVSEIIKKSVSKAMLAITGGKDAVSFAKHLAEQYPDSQPHQHMRMFSCSIFVHLNPILIVKHIG